jgi:hypothetical protein
MLNLQEYLVNIIWKVKLPFHKWVGEANTARFFLQFLVSKRVKVEDQTAGTHYFIGYLFNNACRSPCANHFLTNLNLNVSGLCFCVFKTEQRWRSRFQSMKSWKTMRRTMMFLGCARNQNFRLHKSCTKPTYGRYWNRTWLERNRLMFIEDLDNDGRQGWVLSSSIF